jgi:hypothetical protein
MGSSTPKSVIHSSALMARHRLPAMHGYRDFVAAL